MKCKANAEVMVAIPCYNEALTIGKVVADFKCALPDADIVVFDNNSSDDSATLAERAGARVVSVCQQGKGNVVRAIFQQDDADVCVMVDGDDTYPADEVEKLIRPILLGRADMTNGDRLSSTYGKENKRPGHNAGNLLVRWLIKILWHSSVKDVMTGYRAFSRRFVKTCPVLSQRFEIETEMTLHALDKRMPILEIPILYRDRPKGSLSKLNTLSDGVSVLKTIFNMFRFYRPFQFFGGIGLLLLICGSVLLAPVFLEYWKTGLVPRFPTLIFSCFLFMSGMLSISVGLILDAVKKQSSQSFEYLLMEYK